MPTFYEIPFTQYLYPNGVQRPMQYMTEHKDVQKKAEEIIKAGFRFECELLEATGQYHGTITSDVMDHASVLCENGPVLVEQTDKMIRDFDIAFAQQQNARIAQRGALD